MIGVLADQGDQSLVQEFFQLFKTPWEFYRQDKRYDVLLCVSEELLAVSALEANLIVVYAGRQRRFDCEEKIEIRGHRKGGTLLYKGERFPIYGEILTFLDGCKDLLEEQQSRQTAGVRRRVSGRNIVRIGYNLFHEIRFLLSSGQPHEYAAIPTVEIHIAILRDLIVDSGVVLIEIPPIPAGYAFIACLTHDVDHPSIRLHRWDHTVWGFLYRALIGSAINVLRGRASVRYLMINWAAAAKLPFIYIGTAQDFWLDFDRYLSIEGSGGSTFFMLPFKGKPGQTVTGSAPRIRASGYGAEDIAGRIRTIMKGGGEVGLHGIDAWIDSNEGQTEKAEITKITGEKPMGVRMHWLYFNENTPVALEKAGFDYDSTVGYNETVGFRSGTTQVYKPLQVARLLELPLHVMDTALFYSGHLALTFEEAESRIGEFIGHAHQFGGVITINWHDRSIAPERLWGEFYASLLLALKEKGAWCSGAGSVVSWFQGRRSIVFKEVGRRLEITRMGSALDIEKDVPGLRLRIYKVGTGCENSSERYLDLSFKRQMTVCLDGCTVASYN